MNADQQLEPHVGHRNIPCGMEGSFETMVGANIDGMLVIDEEGVVLMANPAAEAMFGGKENLIGTQFGIPTVTDEFCEIDFRLTDGATGTAEMRSTNIKWEDRAATLISFRDVTERKQTQQRIEHLNHVLRGIRDINQLIVQEREPIALIQRACDILVGTRRGFEAAWIVLSKEFQAETQLAHAGLSAAAAAKLCLSVKNGDLPMCCHQAETVEGTSVITADTCGTCSIREEALGSKGYVIALRHQNKRYGYLFVSIFSFFGNEDEEISLIEEIASDLAYALRGIEIAREREEEVRYSAFHIRLLVILNSRDDWATILRNMVKTIKEFTKAEAVGIRLKEGEDYSYFLTHGFSNEFVEVERHLCLLDEKGNIAHDTNGNPFLECMCGNVIAGRIDASLPFFTEGGSFWSNNTTRLLATTSEEDRQARTCNRCNSEGYESVALIPLRVGEETIGLLQLNDTRPNRFSLELIKFFEKISLSIGIAFVGEQTKEENQRIAKFPSEDPNPVLRITKEGKVLYSNEASKLLLAKWNSGVGKAIPEKWRAIIRGIYKPEEVEEEANEKVFSLILTPVKDADYVNVYGLDITARKQAEERLRKVSEVQAFLLKPGSLHDKLKRITDGVVDVIDADFARIWLVRPGDLCESGCMHAEVTEGPHVCRHRDRCLHLLSSSGRYTHLDGEAHRRVPFGCYKIGLLASGEETSFLTNDVIRDPWIHNHEWANALGLVSFAGYQLRSPHDEVIGVLALFSKHPISSEEDALLKNLCNLIVSVIQTTQAEATLREAESKFRTIFEGGVQGVLVADGESKLFIQANPAICDMLGYTEQELKRLRVEDIHPKESMDLVMRTFEDVNRCEKVIGTFPCLRKDGTEFYADIVGNSVVMNGRKCNVAFFLDATERMRAEEEQTEMQGQLIQSQKLEAIGILASGVAHEINNPINGIMNYAQLLIDKIEPGQEIAEFAGEIIHESKRVAKIISSLLAFSRQQPQERSPARVSDIVEETLSLVRSILRHDQITLNVNINKRLPKISCRSQQIQQVIMNLITNARDALNEKYPDGGDKKKISITAKSFKKDEGRWVRITVADSGPGLSDQTYERMFDPFFTTKPRNQGTGLGLSISHGIVMDHGGEMIVESEEGKGTRMHVDLPVGGGSSCP